MSRFDPIPILSTLAHATRLGIYRALIDAGDEGLTAGTVAARTRTAPSSLSGHLAILTRAGVVTAERRGRFIVYRARPERVRALAEHLLET